MIKRQWYRNFRETCVFFYEWVERCETGKAWDLLCKKKKKCSLKSTLCCLTPLFICLFVLIFIFSYQVKLGYLDFVSVDCRKFCALFFVYLFLFFFLCTLFFFFNFSPKIWDFVFPKSSILEFTCWDSFSSLFLLLFFLSFVCFLR